MSGASVAASVVSGAPSAVLSASVRPPLPAPGGGGAGASGASVAASVVSGTPSADTVAPRTASRTMQPARKGVCRVGSGNGSQSGCKAGVSGLMGVASAPAVPLRSGAPPSSAGGAATSTGPFSSEIKGFGLGPWKCPSGAGKESPCAFCGGARGGPPLPQCSGCKAVRYCDRQCQVAHRDAHRPMCRFAALGVPIAALCLRMRGEEALEAAAAARLRRFDLPEAELAEGTLYPLAAGEMMRRRSLRERELGRQAQALRVWYRSGTGSGPSGPPELAPAPLAVSSGWLDGRCCSWCSMRRVLLRCPGCQVLFCSWGCLADAWPSHRRGCRWKLTAAEAYDRGEERGLSGTSGVAFVTAKAVPGVPSSSCESSSEEDNSGLSDTDSESL